MARKVTTIPAKLNKGTTTSIGVNAKRRVAAYARVSTDSDEQFTSYETQISYYTDYIQKNKTWEFVKVYTDGGISGTSTKFRKGFNDMIEDALAGKIDLILTKSVSRFARNTVDSLTAVRLLKDKGVEIYFEKENIWTFDSKGELLITIMSSLAQEESRSLSENIKWGKRKSFADGKVNIYWDALLGYTKDENGKPTIVEEEAKIVRFIYSEFLSGISMKHIAKTLNEQGITTKRGCQWSLSSVQNILSNEKYSGNALLQKTYSDNFLTKTQKKNNGEVTQYYVEDSHPAIIPKKTFDMVQVLLKDSKKKSSIGGIVFSRRVYCGDCGSIYSSKVWHSNDKYRRVVWQCFDKFKNEVKCSTPHFSEEELKAIVLSAITKVFNSKDVIIKTLTRSINTVFDPTDKNAELEVVKTQMSVISTYLESKMNLKGEGASIEFLSHYAEEKKKFEALKTKADELLSDISAIEVKKATIKKYITELKKLETLPLEFSSSLFNALIEKIVVYSKSDIRVIFRDGSEVKESK